MHSMKIFSISTCLKQSSTVLFSVNPRLSLLVLDQDSSFVLKLIHLKTLKYII